MRIRAKMLPLGALVIVMVGVCVALTGCGGGGGGTSSAGKAANSKARIIGTTRVSRAILAISGLGRTITRSAVPPTQKSWSMSGRIHLFFSSAAVAQRASAPTTTPVVPALDPGTGLYYTTTVNTDGSGKQSLFVDQAATQPAGSFVWSTPQWANSKPNTYPAIINVTYAITSGNYAGVAGTMRITVKDPDFKTGLIELALTDSLHESASASLAMSQEGIAGNDSITLGNGDKCKATDTTDSTGNLDTVFTFPDGGSVDISTDPDGTSTETYTNPDGTTATPDLSGTVQPDGTDTIDDGSGNTQTVNVDPGNADSSDSGGDGSDSGGDTSASVHKPGLAQPPAATRAPISRPPLR